MVLQQKKASEKKFSKKSRNTRRRSRKSRRKYRSASWRFGQKTLSDRLKRRSPKRSPSSVGAAGNKLLELPHDQTKEKSEIAALDEEATSKDRPGRLTSRNENSQPESIKELYPYSTVTTLDFSNEDITDQDMTDLAALISVKGALPNLKTLVMKKFEIRESDKVNLDLSNKDLDGTDMKIISHLFANGALPQLKWLTLQSNQIGDIGLSALAGSLSKGALPLLKTLNLEGNNIGDIGLFALACSLSNGALQNLQVLMLEENQIGDVGLSALVVSLSKGALPRLEKLWLSSNQIGDIGLSALAGSLSNGALASLEKLFVPRGYHENPQLNAACDARGIEII